MTDKIHEIAKTKQISLPKDWLEQTLGAKAQYDRLDQVTTVLILPLSWYFAWTKMAMAKKDEMINSNGDLWIWGAYVYFGPVEKPVAGGQVL